MAKTCSGGSTTLDNAQEKDVKGSSDEQPVKSNGATASDDISDISPVSVAQDENISVKEFSITVQRLQMQTEQKNEAILAMLSEFMTTQKEMNVLVHETLKGRKERHQKEKEEREEEEIASGLEEPMQPDLDPDESPPPKHVQEWVKEKTKVIKIYIGDESVKDLEEARRRLTQNDNQICGTLLKDKPRESKIKPIKAEDKHKMTKTLGTIERAAVGIGNDLTASAEAASQVLSEITIIYTKSILDF